MVIEYASKGCLQEFLRRNRPGSPAGQTPKPNELVRFASQIANGMAHIASKQVKIVAFTQLHQIWTTS